MQWVLDHMQYLHLAVFAVASISVEWRRPGLILAGFALLYLILTPFHAAWKVADPSMFMLMYVLLDMLGAFLIFEFCRPSKNHTSYRTKHWLGLSGILIAFWVSHYLNFCYTMGYSFGLAPPIYDWVLVGLALATIFVATPGAKEGIYEALEMVKKKLALPADAACRPSEIFHERPDAGAQSGHSGVAYWRFSTVLVGRGRRRILLRRGRGE